MRPCIVFLLLVAVGSLSAASAQEPANKSPEQVKIRFSEYRLPSAEALELNNEELLSRIMAQSRNKDESFAVIAEQLVFTHSIGSHSSIQCGRQIGLVTGQSVDARGLSTRNINYREVGTMVEVTSSPTDQPEALQLELEYSSSRLQPVAADIPPEISNCRIKSQIVVKKGKPILLLGKSDADHVALVLLVE